MRTVLGIDAGGTFTDCVIVNSDDRAILHKSKTLTTRHDLIGCLTATFAGLPAHLLRSIDLVCLSTTLATNAVVEGRGCKEGLILLGGKPSGNLPASRLRLVRGRFDLKGRVVEKVDPREIEDAVESLRDEVEAVAVSGYASVRCPEHELYVKAVVEDRLRVPVVCAHELTTSLGFRERTVSAALNARLIPLVCDLMDTVRRVMADHDVEAPLMMVRGDGTLMADGLARSRPIETVLSGPAASAIGAVHLSGLDDCLVMDIGGTTTDIANVSSGRPDIRPTGARVGDWSTQVRAADVFTVGLGGDSRLSLDGGGQLRIGPQRSTSFSTAGMRHPALVRELEQILSSGAHLGFLHPEQEAYEVSGRSRSARLSREQQLLLDELRDGPRTLFHLNRTLDAPNIPTVLASLVDEGVLERISLTPTDIWHVTGQYTPGDVRAATLAAQITAAGLGLTLDSFTDHVRRALRDRIESSAVRAAMHMDDQDPELSDGGPADYFINDLHLKPTSRLMRASFELLKPVVGVGAPAASWLDGSVERSLFAAEVPEHAEVANAIGAAIAHSIEKVDVLIREDTVTGHYLVFSPTGRDACRTLEDATEAARSAGERFLAHLARRDDLVTTSQVQDFEISSLNGDSTVFVERVISLSADLQS